MGSPGDVDAIVEEARAAGARIGREPAETFWGGYSAVFVDPDGHPWEVAHNPHWTITADGGVRPPRRIDLESFGSYKPRSKRQRV